MAYEEVVVCVTRPAGADLSDPTNANTFVKLNSNGEVVKVSALTDKPFGVLTNDPKLGEGARIAISGLVKVRAGAALATGASVSTNTAGKAITGATGSYRVGDVVVGGASGDIITVALSTVAAPITV